MARLRNSLNPWPRPPGPQRAVCHVCDTLHEAPPVAEGMSARCRRCGAVLYQNRPASLARTTAFALTSLLLMAGVHGFPFLTMKSGGIQTELSLWLAAGQLIREGSPVIGLGVAVFTILAPAVIVLGVLYVNVPLLVGRAAPGAKKVARLVAWSEPWNMIEVFLLGVLVSLLKLASMADLSFGYGFWAFAGLMVCMAAASAGIDRNELWDRLEVART